MVNLRFRILLAINFLFFEVLNSCEESIYYLDCFEFCKIPFTFLKIFLLSLKNIRFSSFSLKNIIFGS